MTNPPRTKQNYVYVSLRDDIQTGKLSPGTKLTLIDLQNRFSMSHIPIREALRTLEKEGFIELHPHASAIVKRLSVQEALWIAEIRIILEPIAVSKAMQYLDNDDIKTIEKLISTLDDVIDAGSVEDYFALNYQLHKCLFSRTPNQYLARITNELAEMMNRYNTIAGKPGLMATWQEEHKSLLEAIKQKEVTVVQDLMLRHLEHMTILLKEAKIN